jgi:hypothetical protein
MTFIESLSPPSNRISTRTRARWLSLPAALLVATSATAAWADDVPISDAARQHFQAGVNLLQDPDGARYAEAYREFQSAYADSPSWKILSNLGIAALKLERDGEAADAFGKYLAEGGSNIDDAERAQVERDLQTLKTGLVKITLQSSPPGAMLTDERVPNAGGTVVNRYGPLGATQELGVRSGHHRMTAAISGYKDSVWEFDTPKQGPAHEFKLEQVPVAGTANFGGADAGASPPSGSAKRPVPAGVFVGVAVTGALAAGGAVVGVLASSKHSDYNTANANIQTQSDQDHARSLKNSGQKLNLIADGLFAGAVVAAGVTAVLFFTRPTHEAPAAVSWRLSPAMASNGGGLFLSGAFH